MGFNTMWLDIFFRIAPACFYELSDVTSDRRALPGERVAPAHELVADYMRMVEEMTLEVFQHIERRNWRSSSQVQELYAQEFRAFQRPRVLEQSEQERVQHWREQRMVHSSGACHTVIIDGPVYLFKLLSPPAQGPPLTWADVSQAVRHLVANAPGVRRGITRYLVVLFDDHAYVPRVKSIEQQERRGASSSPPFTREELASGQVTIGQPTAPVPEMARMMATACLRPLLIAFITHELLEAVAEITQWEGGLTLVVDGAVTCVDARVASAADRLAQVDDPQRWAAALPPAVTPDAYQVTVRRRAGERTTEEDTSPRRRAPLGEADQKFLLWLARTMLYTTPPGTSAMLCSSDSDWALIWMLNAHRMRRQENEYCLHRVFLDTQGKTRASGRPRVVDLVWLTRELKFFVCQRLPGVSEPLIVLVAMVMLTGTDYVKGTIPRLGPVTLFQTLFGASATDANRALIAYFIGDDRTAPISSNYAGLTPSLVASPTSSSDGGGGGGSESLTRSLRRRLRRVRTGGNSRLPPPPPPGVPIFRMRDTQRASPPEASEADAPIDYLMVAEDRFVCFLLNVIGQMYAGSASQQENRAVGEHIARLEHWFGGDSARRLQRSREAAFRASARKQGAICDTVAYTAAAATTNIRERFILSTTTTTAKDGEYDGGGGDPIIDVDEMYAAYPLHEERDPDGYRERIVAGMQASSSRRKNEMPYIPTTLEMLALVRRVVWELMYRMNSNSVLPLDPLQKRDGVSVWGWCLEVREDVDRLSAAIVLTNNVWFNANSWPSGS